MCSLRHESDRQLAEPLGTSPDRHGPQVTSLVPPGYKRYVRVLNPVEIAPGSVVMWSDVVRRGGLETSPWMQWDEVTVSSEAMPANKFATRHGQPACERRKHRHAYRPS